MKRLWACVLLALPLLFTPPRAVAEWHDIWTYAPVCWDFTVDSCAANLTTTAGSTLTSVPISTFRWNWDSPGAVNTTAFVAYRLIFGASSRTGTGADSIYYAIDISHDGVNWVESTALTGVGNTIEGALTLTVGPTVDADAGVVNPFAAPFLRIRMQGDVASGSDWIGMTCRIGHKEASNN